MQHGYGDEDVSGCGVSGIHYSMSTPNPSTAPHYMQQQMQMQHLSYFNPIPVSQQVYLFQDLNEEEESSIKEPFWRPLDLDYKKEKDNCKIFSELEAICKPTSANAITQSDEKMKKKRRGKKKKEEQRLNSIALFFESLTKNLIEHQEELHRKFLDAMERKDQERMRKQEAWMKQEAEKATARAEEHAISSARVSTIISFLENITKESVKLPQGNNYEDNDRTIQEAEKGKIKVLSSDIRMYSNRWPKAEVEELIGIRSKLEFMFKEAGVKGHLWDEVSSRMRRMGFNRSAKRCKEKWENINKYFRKTKESGKARPVNSKTCSYFHHLDELYAKSSMSASTSSELLDAIVVPNEQVSFKFSEDHEDGQYDDDDHDHDDHDDDEEEEERGEI